MSLYKLFKIWLIIFILSGVAFYFFSHNHSYDIKAAMEFGAVYAFFVTLLSALVRFFVKKWGERTSG